MNPSLFYGKKQAFSTLLVFALFACASTNPDIMESSQETETEMELRLAVENLESEIVASGTRNRKLAEHLQQVEEENTSLSIRIDLHEGKLISLEKRLDTIIVNQQTPVVVEKFQEKFLDVQSNYDRAYRTYKNRQYNAALIQFADIVSIVPQTKWSDNAQYWMGECQYAMGEFRQALAEFTKVFAYQGTEKNDDSQLKIARCYLALGEKERAINAFQKFLYEHPNSEYVEAAQKEMRYLQGP